jgi:hypothetical protein
VRGSRRGKEERAPSVVAESGSRGAPSRVRGSCLQAASKLGPVSRSAESGEGGLPCRGGRPPRPRERRRRWTARWRCRRDPRSVAKQRPTGGPSGNIRRVPIGVARPGRRGSPASRRLGRTAYFADAVGHARLAPAVPPPTWGSRWWPSRTSARSTPAPAENPGEPLRLVPVPNAGSRLPPLSKTFPSSPTIRRSGRPAYWSLRDRQFSLRVRRRARLGPPGKWIPPAGRRGRRASASRRRRVPGDSR